MLVSTVDRGLHVELQRLWPAYPVKLISPNIKILFQNKIVQKINLLLYSKLISYSLGDMTKNDLV